MSEIPSATEFEEDVLSVGKLIQKRRDSLGLSQKETADRAEISLSALKQYETDRAQPPLDKAIRLADVLKINPHSFFDELGVPNEDRSQKTRSPDVQLMKVLTELSSAIGATVTFDEPKDNEGFVEVRTDCDALDKLRNLVQWKGINSRHLPGTLADAEAALWNLDMDEIEVIASDSGIPEEFLLEVHDALSMTPEKRDKRCKDIIPRILIATVYEPVLEYLDRNDLEFVAKDVASSCFNRSTSIEAKAWLSESAPEYVERLRWQVAEELKQALMKGKPYVFPDNLLHKVPSKEDADDQPEFFYDEDPTEGNEE